MLGSKSDFPTRRLAQRELDKRLVVVNDPRYRARPTATFTEFAARWESLVLVQHKLSTQVTMRSHLRKHLNPFFGRMQMRDIGPEEVQRFISSVEVSPKTKKNLVATLQMLWNSARLWGYVAHDAVSDIVLPKRYRVTQRSYALEEIQRTLEAAKRTGAHPLLACRRNGHAGRGIVRPANQRFRSCAQLGEGESKRLAWEGPVHQERAS